MRLRFLPIGVRDANISASVACVKIKKGMEWFHELFALSPFCISPFHLSTFFTFSPFSPFHLFTVSHFPHLYHLAVGLRLHLFVLFLPLLPYLTPGLGLYFNCHHEDHYPLFNFRPGRFHLFTFSPCSPSPFFFLIYFLAFHLFTFFTFLCFTIQHFVHLICWIVRSSCPKRLSLFSVGA